MRKGLRTRRKRIAAALCLGLLTATAPWAQSPNHSVTPAGGCTRLELAGEVKAGQEWKAPLGEGWVFRLIPIQGGGGPAARGAYSGWDLVVDREAPAGYPDALLLATPPFNSINERELGTTFGLRAQDALGWNPRTFHFLVDPAALTAGQALFAELNRTTQAANSDEAVGRAQALAAHLMALQAHAASGELRILDARLSPGTADAARFAESWALASTKTPHSFEPPSSGLPTPLGEFHWIKFSLALWLPESWKAPPNLRPKQAPCPQ